MIRCAQDVYAECEKAGDSGELAGSSQSCLPLYQEEDQRVVNFRDVLQRKMAVGLKSSEGKGHGFRLRRSRRNDHDLQLTRWHIDVNNG